MLDTLLRGPFHREPIDSFLSTQDQALFRIFAPPAGLPCPDRAHATEPQDQLPRAIFAPEPEYSDKAGKEKINGELVLPLIVGTDGLPRDITVEKMLGYGLDEQAVKAVQPWRFQPALRDGQPVEKRHRSEFVLSRALNHL